MKLSQAPELSGFKSDVLAYRLVATVVTVVFGVFVFIGWGNNPVQLTFALQTALWLSFVTGVLGAGVTTYGMGKFIRQAIESCVINDEDLVKSNYTIWREHLSDWSFTPLLGVVIVLTLLVFCGGEKGTLWIVLYSILSPVLASVFRAISMTIMKTPAHRVIASRVVPLK